MEESRGETSLPAQIARKSLARSHADAGAEAEIEFGGDDAAVSDTQLQDEVLRLFDALELRTHKIPDEEWASTAKARAEKIRFGGEKHIMWWDADRARYPLEHVRLKADTGVHDFRIDSQVCENLRLFLADPCNYDGDGYLKMAGTQFPGYGGYPYVHAPGGHLRRAQELRTVRVHGRSHVNAVLKSTPQVMALVMEVRRVLGLPMPSKRTLQKSGKSILALHFLLQDETQQALFSWHADAEDLQGLMSECTDDMTTVIVHLSDEESGMRIWGCAPSIYSCQGGAVAFPGAALHESLPRRVDAPARGVVRKVALFYN